MGYSELIVGREVLTRLPKLIQEWKILNRFTFSRQSFAHNSEINPQRTSSHSSLEARIFWWAHPDLNREPTVYETAALTD